LPEKNITQKIPKRATLHERNYSVDIKTLNGDISAGIRKPVYLLYGEERFLVAHYAHALGEGFDHDTFTDNANVGEIILSADAFPFLAEKRAVYLRESRLFASGRKADSEAMAAYIPHIPAETVLIFVETDVDKRLKLYKKVAEAGRAVDCAPLSPPELSRWVEKKFRAHGKTLSPAAASTLMRNTAHSMTALGGEIDKLASYAGARPSITEADIAALCIPTLQTRIFDLLGAMGKADAARALTLYANMLHMKESPLMILTMLIRQFRILLQCKAAQEKNIPRADMGKQFGLQGFIVTEALNQAKRFPIETLIQALADCQETDARIKTGRIDMAMGVEMLIAKYSMRIINQNLHTSK